MLKRITKLFQYLFGFNGHWADSRPADISTGITRIAVFTAVMWVNFIVMQAMGNDAVSYALEKTHSVYHPFGLLLLLGDKPPGPLFWQLTQILAFVSTPLAILGLATRPAMIISVISSLLLVLLDASRYNMWSHPYNVIFLGAIPFMFSHAGRRLSLDSLIARKFPKWFFTPSEKPIFWSVLSVQYSAALFYFGALWAKLLISKGGWEYVVSDNMRNILAITWDGYVEVDTPFYIDIIVQAPLLWMSITLVHLIMQGLPLCVVFAVHRPAIRLFEGAMFALSCLGLTLFMSVFDPWWYLLVVAFIDWDYYLPRIRAWLIKILGGEKEKRLHPLVASSIKLKRPLFLVLFLGTFFSVYCLCFLFQVGDKYKLYPFSNMDMYAAVYVNKPIEEHSPFVDFLKGNMTIEFPRHNTEFDMQDGRWIRTDILRADIKEKLLPKISRKITEKDILLYELAGNQLTFVNLPDTFHLLCREQNLKNLKGGIEEFIQWSSPLPSFPPGSSIILYQETQAYTAYPEKLEKMKPYHSAVRAVYDINDRVFSGMSVVRTEKKNLVIEQVDNLKTTGRVFANIYSTGRVIDRPKRVSVPGKWVNSNTYEVEEGFKKKYQGLYTNTIIEAKTPSGKIYEFDGPVFWW